MGSCPGIRVVKMLTEPPECISFVLDARNRALIPPSFPRFERGLI